MDQKVFYGLSYGMYVLTTKIGDEFAGCIVNTVCQVTAEERPKLTVAVNKENQTNIIMKKAKKVNISILSQEADMLLIGKFGFRSSKNFNKLQDTNYITGSNQIPIVTEDMVSYIECNILKEIDCGTHTVFVLEAQDSKMIENKPVMTYDYYHTVVKGKTPPKASSFIR